MVLFQRSPCMRGISSACFVAYEKFIDMRALWTETRHMTRNLDVLPLKCFPSTFIHHVYDWLDLIFQVYELMVMEVKPNDAVSIIECDMNVSDIQIIVIRCININGAPGRLCSTRWLQGTTAWKAQGHPSWWWCCVWWSCCSWCRIQSKMEWVRMMCLLDWIVCLYDLGFCWCRPASWW